jgi:hypothetical protein
MGSPTYTNHAVNSGQKGRKYLHLICRLSDLAFRLLQNSNFDDDFKAKVTDWRETCQNLCALADAAWADLPDGP